MSKPLYLNQTIVETRFTKRPRYGLTVEGFTLRAGAPTSMLVRLEGESRWRRLMVWQFSNAGTLFLRIGGVPHIVPRQSIPER